MYISYAEILNFRALKSISIPLQKFSIILGENDVGKTSFLYALDTFFSDKKVSDANDFFKKVISENIIIKLTFKDIPENDTLNTLKRANGEIIIQKIFAFDKPPIANAILDNDKAEELSKKVLNE